MVFYKYVSAKRIDILQNRLIRFTQPNAMNDPFEGQPHFYVPVDASHIPAESPLQATVRSEQLRRLKGALRRILRQVFQINRR